MATTIKPRDALYAVLGVADTAFEKAKTFAGDARTFADRNRRDPKTFVQTTAKELRTYVSGRAGDMKKRVTRRQRTVTRTYNQLAARGQTLLTRIRRQAPTQRAAEQVRTAQRQARRTVKTVRKAATDAAQATAAAVQKVG